MKHSFSITAKILLLAIIGIGTLSFCIRKKDNLGKEIQRTIAVTPFENIEVNGNADVFIQQGDSFQVVLKGKEKYIDLTKITCLNGTLTIDQGWKDASSVQEMTFGITDRMSTKIYVTLPRLRKLAQTGNSSISIDKPFTGDSILFDIQGNADINIAKLKADYLNVYILGNASADFTNLTVGKTEMEIQGNASLDAHMNNAGEVSLSIQGNASVDLDGTTRTEPHINITGNASVSNNTTRIKPATSSKNR